MRHLIVLATLLAAAAAAAMPRAGAAEMPPERRQAIEAVIEDYLVRNPEVIERALRSLEAKRKSDEAAAVQAAIQTHREELFERPATPIGGNAQGDVTMVEFFDYRCGVCRRVHPILASLMKSDDRIRRVYKEWPILGPDSLYASRAALASRAQGKYLAFHDALMESRSRLDKADVLKVASRVGIDTERLQRDMDSPEISAIIERNYALAQALRINGTPSFLIGDQLVRGGRDLATMRKLIAEARAAAKN